MWSGQAVCVGIGKFNFGSQVSNSCRYQAIGVEGGWERVMIFLDIYGGGGTCSVFSCPREAIFEIYVYVCTATEF